MSDSKAYIEEIDNLVYQGDLEGLVNFSKEVPEDNTDQWREDVMELGFRTFFSYLSYDQMCGKLGDGGLDFLDEIIEEAETFCGARLNLLRAKVLSYRLDEVQDKDVEQAKVFALQAIEELSISNDNKEIKYRATLYHDLARLDIEHALYYWSLAIKDLKETFDINLAILYHPWDESIEGISKAQDQAFAEFDLRIKKELKANPDLICFLLQEGTRTLSYLPNAKLELQVSRWFENSLAWQNESAEPILLREAGLLLHKQGIKEQREDYFAKAIECFENFILKDPAHAMEVYYTANVLEDWAELKEIQGLGAKEYLAKAWDVYQRHENIVRINFSPLLHYAEFLERLYFNEKITEKPTQQQILLLAAEAEVMGNGYYSGPGMIMTRLAISNNDADTAIYHLCRLLLRHELCIDNLIKGLRESLTEKAPKAVADFLDQTLVFIDEVDHGYYYDSAFSIEDLNKLNQLETLIAWENRKTEIINKYKYEIRKF